MGEVRVRREAKREQDAGYTLKIKPGFAERSDTGHRKRGSGSAGWPSIKMHNCDGVLRGMDPYYVVCTVSEVPVRHPGQNVD